MTCEVSERSLHFKDQNSKLGYVMVDMRTKDRVRGQAIVRTYLHKNNLIKAIESFDQNK